MTCVVCESLLADGTVTGAGRTQEVRTCFVPDFIIELRATGEAVNKTQWSQNEEDGNTE